jgi:hypothetical protein
MQLPCVRKRDVVQVHGASAPGAALASAAAHSPAAYSQQPAQPSMALAPGGGAHGYMQSGVVGGFKEEKVFITGLDNPPPNFSVMGKLLGPGGSYIKHICAETGCKTYLRGLGSKQQPGDTGFGEPLHIHIQGMRNRPPPRPSHVLLTTHDGRWPRGKCGPSCRTRSEPDSDREGRVR